LALSACAYFSARRESTVSGPPGRAQGQWHAKAMVRDLKNHKSSELLLEIVAIEPSRMRMDVTSNGLGIYLASVAMNGDEVRVLLARERRFIISRADRSALAGLIPLRIPPQAILDLLFARPLDKKEWLCEDNAAGGGSGVERGCSLAGEHLTVVWNTSETIKRRFEINSPNGRVIMSVEESWPKVDIKPEMFFLTPPQDFRIETL
jgi:hypothetical protein